MGAESAAGEVERRIVSNTGPILHLWEASGLHLLKLAGRLSIPQEVDRELKRYIPGWEEARPAWIETAVLNRDRKALARQWQQAGLLDAGEAEALELARSVAADWFLTDDAAARFVGTRLGLEVHGSLGVLLWTAANRLLSQAEAVEALDRLEQTSLWLSQRVRTEARTALETLYED